MKKSLVALAAIAFVGVASAQSSVTLYGVVDTNITHTSQGGLSRTFMDRSGNNSSQLGFRGTEDLGGGMSANFWLEADVGSNTGGIGGASTTSPSVMFNRRSTVSLAGGFGEIRLGRDYTPTFLIDAKFDPFGFLGVGSVAKFTPVGAYGPVYGRADNSIQYLWGFAPNAIASAGSGIYAQLMYAFPGNASGTPSVNQYAGGRIGYANGPLNVAGAYANTHGTPLVGTSANNYKIWSIGGSYDFGLVTAMAEYGVNKNDVPGNKWTHWELGATINAGPGYIPVSYNRTKNNDGVGGTPGADQWAVGYVYNLSKRTALYGTYSHVNNKNGATTFNIDPVLATNAAYTAGGSGNGYQIGLRTRF